MVQRRPPVRTAPFRVRSGDVGNVQGAVFRRNDRAVRHDRDGGLRPTPRRPDRSEPTVLQPVNPATRGANVTRDTGGASPDGTSPL